MKLTEQCFVKLKKKKRITNIEWSDEKDSVLQYANCLYHGEVDLTSGKFTKNYYNSNWRNKIISITFVKSEDSGVTIVAVLSSCVLVFYHIKSKTLRLTEGPRELVTHLSQFANKKSSGPIQQLQNFAKQHRFRRSNENDKESSDAANDTCTKIVPSILFKPKVFSSKDLSKVILIANYTKVFLMTEEAESSKTLKDPWNIYEVPSDIDMPSENAKEACTDVTFIVNGPTGSSLCVAYSFASESHLFITSLIVQWHAKTWISKGSPSHKWITKKVDMKKISSAIFYVKRKNSLVMKFSMNEHFLCLAVNTLKNCFYLIYYHLDCQSVAVVECSYPMKVQESSNRYQWVSCLAWGTNNNFIIGCLRSGHVFIATRCGPLMKINWNNTDQVASGLSYINMFSDFNISNRSFENKDISEISSQTSNFMSPRFSILSDFSSNRIVVSSGLNFCQFELPNDVCSNEGVLSFLLKRTHYANHRFESLLMTHEYDFIHCSNWRLASKTLQKVTNKKNQNEEKMVCSLWFPGNVPFANSSIGSVVQTDLEAQKKEMFELLQATWSLLVLRNFKKKERKLLTKASVSEALKLFCSIMKTSSGNDNEEHQASLLQSLRFFHFLTEYVSAVTPYSFKLIKPCFQVLHRLLNLIMKSVREASSERKLICIIILTQTLTSLKSTLLKGNLLSSFYSLDGQEYKFGNLLDCAMRKQWMFLYKNILSVWDEERIRKHSQLNCMLIVALNIIQEHILTCFHLQRKKKVTNMFKMFCSGKYLITVDKVKTEIEQIIYSSFCQKRVKKNVFFAFHVLIIESRWQELIKFVYWFYQLIFTKLKSVEEKIICSRKLKLLTSIFEKLCGVLGIFMSKFILGIPVHILHSFEYYEYTSLYDNPKKNYKILTSEKYFEKTLFSPLNAVRCLIIGRKYEALFHLASKKNELYLGLFSLFAMGRISSKNVESLEDFIINTIFKRLTNSLENPSDEEISQSELYFITEQFFHLGVLEEMKNVLPECLRKCLIEIKNLIKDLPLIVPFNFHLPSPPLFCPQMDSRDYADVGLDDDEARREFHTRQNISCWINHFCLLCSSSGVDGFFVSYIKEEGLEFNYKLKDITHICSLLLQEKESLVMENDNQWNELKWIWISFLELVCALHTRDKISLILRTLTEEKANKRKYKNIQLVNFQVMRELNKVFNSPWKEEAFSLTVTSAVDASFTKETAYFLAVAVAHQHQIPSLHRDKLHKVLELWKTVEIISNNDEYQNSGDILNLFDLYQKYLKLQEKKVKSENQTQAFSLPLSKEYTDMICLLISTTFLKRQMEFPEFEKNIPYLQQFSNQIKDAEFEGMKPADVLSTFIKIQTSKIFKESSIEKEYYNSPAKEKQRKGLFRSNRTKQSFESTSDTARIIYNNINISHSKSKGRTKSFSHVKKQASINNILKRSKSLNNLNQKQEIYRTVSPLKFDKSECSSSILFSEFIGNMFYSSLYMSYDCTKMSSRFMNFVLWILRNDRMSLSRDLRSAKVPTNLQDIFSIHDLKQAIIWYSSDVGTKTTNLKDCKRKINKQNNSRCKDKITKDVEFNNNNNKNNNNNHNSGEQQKNVKKVMYQNEEVQSTQCSLDDSCNNKLIDPLPQNSKHNPVPSSEVIYSNQNLRPDRAESNIKGDQWQPFVVKDKSSTLSHTLDSKPEAVSCHENTENKSKSSCEGSSRLISCNGTKEGSGFSITSEETGISSSQRYDIILNNVIENTLDDLTLSNEIPESELEHSSLPDFNVPEKCSAIKENKLKTFFERNNLTFLKIPLLQNNKYVENVDIKNLNSQNFSHQLERQKTNFVQPSPLDLSQFFSNGTNPVMNKEADWTLKRIPLNLLQEDNFRSDVKVPSKLLKISLEQETKYHQPILKEIRLPIKAIQKQMTHPDVPTFRLLKIPNELKSTKVYSNKKQEISNLINNRPMRHGTTIQYELDTKEPSFNLPDKFTETVCKNDLSRLVSYAVCQTEKTEAHDFPHKTKLDGHNEKMSNAKIKGKLINSEIINTCRKRVEVAVTDKSTQTKISENHLVSKGSVTVIDSNIQGFPNDPIMQKTLIENRTILTNLKEVHLESREISTQTKNSCEISTYRISAETQTFNMDTRRVTDKATSTTLRKVSDRETLTSLENMTDKETSTTLGKVTDKATSTLLVKLFDKETSTTLRRMTDKATLTTQVTQENPHGDCTLIENSIDDDQNFQNRSLTIKPISLNEYSNDIADFHQGDKGNLEKNNYQHKTLLKSVIKVNDDNYNNNDNDAQKPEIENGMTVDRDFEDTKMNDNLSLFNSDKEIYSDDNVIEENFIAEYPKDKSEKELVHNLVDYNSLNNATRLKPETFQDVISLFMSGSLQVDEVCSFASSFPEYIDIMNSNSKDRTETPRSLLSHAVKDINTVKQEISNTKSLLEKVDKISKRCFQEDLNLAKYFSKFLDPRKSSPKKSLPTKQSPEHMLEFLQQISPKDLTQEEISQIMNFVEREAKKDCQINVSLENKSIGPTIYSPTLTQSEMFFSEIADNSQTKSLVESNYSYEGSNDHINYQQQQSPDLNLNLPKYGLGGYSPIPTVTPSDSLATKEQRRKEIRAFMQRKRRERRENSGRPSVSENKESLTGKEIMERNRFMKIRREKLKEEHLKKRKDEFQFILEDHFHEKKFVEPILRSKIRSISPSHRSLIINKKLKTENESLTNLNEEKERKKNQHLGFRSDNSLLRREVAIFRDYLDSPQHTYGNFRFKKRELSPNFKPSRGTIIKSPVKETFTRSLDRISEIDSSSLSSTLTESSWSLPDDIKRILNKNDENS